MSIRIMFAVMSTLFFACVPEMSEEVTDRADAGAPDVSTGPSADGGAVSSDAGGAVTVSITSPAEGARVVDTFTVAGNSSRADEVVLFVDEEAPQPVNGLESWTVIFEPGSLVDGTHTLTAVATGPGGTAQHAVRVRVEVGVGDTRSITYSSSVDGIQMGAALYVPTNLSPAVGSRPLVVHLHGGGGTGYLRPSIVSELERRGWIGIAPDGRAWGLAEEGCPWQTSAAYVDSPDPKVGPGERDIFDAIEWVKSRYAVDPDRIYLTGFSMGGRGTYAIGLKNPDFFAAIAPMGPAIDMFEIFARRPEPIACKEGMAGGRPGDSVFVDTMYSITSGRFLIENAHNLAVFHGHGLDDTTANNTPDNAPFLHGFHISTDGAFAACHQAGTLCFGHTPTLGELEARHPGAFDWSFMFTPVGHTTDDRWITGTPIQPGLLGSEDPQSPGRLLGIMEFFARHVRVESPDTVIFKTYEDQHRSAHWLTVDVESPWTNTPGAVRATREIGRLSLELMRARRVSIDLARAGLEPRELEVDLARLDEPTYDPALAPRPVEITTLVLEGDDASWPSVSVTRDGLPLDPNLIFHEPDRLEIGPLLVEGPTALVVAAE